MGNHWPRGDGVFQREDPTRPDSGGRKLNSMVPAI